MTKSLLCRHRFEGFVWVGRGRGAILFAGFERERLCELDRDTMQKAAYAVDSTDVGRTCEIRHVKGTVRAITGHTEAGGYVLARVGAFVVGVAGEGGASAGEIDHLPL